MKGTKPSASVKKPFVAPRRATWLEKHPDAEKTFTTLGAEFLCGCVWSLSTVFFAVPGIQDMIAAVTADRVGFDIVYGMGYWLTASAYGLPDAGIATYTDDDLGAHRGFGRGIATA